MIKSYKPDDHIRKHKTDKLSWKKIQSTEFDKNIDEDIHIPDDHDQSPPLKLQILFDPEVEGVYDVGWAVEPETDVKAGEPILHAYRTSDGLPFIQTAPYNLKISDTYVKRTRKIVRGDSIAKVTIPSISLDLADIRKEVANMQMELAQAVNAVFKGYMGFLGESGQVTNRVTPVKVMLHPEEGYLKLLDEIVETLSKQEIIDGDIIVLTEKIFAIAQGRLFPLHILYENDPKTLDELGRKDILNTIKDYVPQLDLKNLILADAIPNWHSGPMATAGVFDPNQVAFDISQKLKEKTGVTCDIVISDTDTGLDIRETLINCITIGATPLGATNGLVIYECMRVANAAEFARGSNRGIPIVICRPHERRAKREAIGEYRGYNGRLDAEKERLIGFA